MSLSQTHSRGRSSRVLAALLPLAFGVLAVVATPTVATAAVGDTMIAWLEVENGQLQGGPGENQGDHGNFSGTGSYTFREPGMRSTMSFTAPAAGVYPVWIRYSAGGLGSAEDDDVTRKMGLLVNGGSRQRLDFPATFVAGEPDEHDGWERWSWTRTDVTLNEGANTIAVDCQRDLSVGETCRLNFDAIQVGGSTPTAPSGGTPAAPCTPSTTIPAGATRLFDGTFASLDGTIAAPRWHKAGSGGFGFQNDCTLRGFRGQGTTWTLAQHTGPYTLGVDFLRGAPTSASSIYVGSTTNGQPSPTGGYQLRIGPDDTGYIVSADGTVTSAPDPTALAAALKPQGQWNRFAVQVTPGRIRVLLNGTPVNAVDRVAATNGYIGLENRAGDDAAGNVRFRNIYVEQMVELGQLAGPAKRAVKADGTTPNPGGESTLGNLVAESQRWATRGSSGGTARIAFVTPTALRADLPGPTATYAQAAAVLEAEPLVNMRLTGAQIKTVLEQQWQTTAGGQVPSPAFVRLGASSGFTWTHDASRPQGDRITGTWLDGAPLNPSGNYSVTVSQSLANGGDNFRAFTSGLVPQVRQATTLSALAAYVGDASTGGALALPAVQRAVGVSVPGAAPSSYVAGTTYAVDLSSWSYSAATDPQDSTVDVTIGGQPAGTFPVDATRSDNAFDEDGKVAVRATIPADLAAGATTVRIVGTTTGTTVTRSIAVTAAPPAPTPTPTPTPAPTPTPTPTPTTPPAVTKAKPTLKVTVKPARVVAKETKPKLVVTLASTGATPTGKVTVRVAGKTYVARLRRGKAVVTLKAFAQAGKVRAKVSYAGDAVTLSAARTVRIAVLRP